MRDNAVSSAALQALEAINVPRALGDRLVREGRFIDLPAGARVFAPGQACQGWFLVLGGCVRVTFTADTGREIVLYRVARGQSCIMTTACLLGEEPYGASGETEAETKALMVPTSIVGRLLDDAPEFRRLVFQGFGRRLSEILKTMEDAMFHRVDARLARLLVGKADEHGRIAATQTELAADLGTAREVVSRLLARWAEEGMIDRRRGEIRIRAGDRLSLMCRATVAD